MTLTEKIIFGAVVVAVSLVGSYFLFFRGTSLQSFGAVGGLLAEHYIPYVATNQGYNSALPIQTTSTLAAGATTLSGTLTITTSNAATSTEVVGCIQTYATSTATPVILQLNKSNTATTTFSGTAFGEVDWQFGTCPK